MAGKAKGGKPGAREAVPPGMVTTAIYLPREDLALLRRVAVERANKRGGRLSVSDVIRELIEGKRRELQAEADRR